MRRLLNILKCMAEFCPLTINPLRTWKRLLSDALAICIRHKTDIGIELKHPSFQPTKGTATTTSTSTRPPSGRPNNIVSCHCKRRGHVESSCWQKFLHIKPASVNFIGDQPPPIETHPTGPPTPHPFNSSDTSDRYRAPDDPSSRAYRAALKQLPLPEEG